MWSRVLAVSAIANCLVVGGCLVGGCGETRALDLFPKKDPAPPMMPAPGVACGEMPMCPPDRNACVDGQCVQCGMDAQCVAPMLACLEGVCVECRTNEQCPMDKACHPEAGHCTESCIDSTQCKDKNRSVCDVARGLCVKCTTDGECGAKHVCDPRINECVGCVDDGNCPDGGVCDLQRRECAK
jgi:hypothetical protein